MDNKLKNNQDGFSLMELLVATTIFILILAMGYSFISQGFKSTTYGSEQEEAVKNARRAMNIMTKEIRGANSSEQGDYTIDTAGEQNFVFYGDVDNDGLMEKVRYFKDEMELKKVITEPGPSYDYNATPSTTTISQYVNNEEELIFTYYDSNYNITNTINEIRLINISLKINVTPWRAPNDYYVESDVSFRNLKTNL